MNGTERLVFVILFLFAIGFFLRNVYRLFAMMCLGRWENRFDHLWARVKGMLFYAFGQRRVVSEKFGVNHFLIFWGFMVLLLINAEFLVRGIFPRFSFEFLGRAPYGVLLFIADVASVVVLATAAIAAVRRIFFRPSHIEGTFDAFIILILIGSLMVAYFGMNVCEIRLGQSTMVAWLPVSGLLSGGAAAVGSAETVHLVGRVFWWVHALVLLCFLNYLPYGKHLHIMTAIPNCFFKSFSFVTTVPRMVFRKGFDFGVSRVVQFSWKDLLDFYTCTECGRCQAACPAHNTDKPLNPKQVIQAGKLNLLANGKAILSSRPGDTLASAVKDAPSPVALIDGTEQSVSADAIWACTTCGACMQKCPVFIEHVPKLIGLRRHLVMEKADFPRELTDFFESSEQRFNPWGIVPTDRAKWAQERNVKTLTDHGNVEYLFFVGCAGAFDSRNRQTTVALAEIFDAAGLSWGILGTEERCCGDSLRRLGNEYVFDQLARDNVEMFKSHGVRKIITQCPHCYNTLKNDYRQFGADFEVLHHSQVICNLLKQGRIKLNGSADGRTVIHDSCFLGRYNNIYDEPREILKAACGRAPLEMQRCRQESFCCGAGGGRMWMEENIGKRISLERTQQAVREDPSTIVVACPYCMTMFENGIKDEKLQDKIKAKDLAEIVVETMVCD